MQYHYYKIVLEFLSAISWPIVALIGLYWLKEPINKFFRNIKTISHGDTRFEAVVSQQEIVHNNTSIQSKIDPFKYLQSFSKNTNIRLTDIVNTEIGLNESNIDGAEKILYNYAKLTIINRFFDKTYYSIYGSQIRILESLNTTNQTKNILKRFYDLACQSNPNLSLYNYDDYLNFLISNELIIVNSVNNNVEITDLGRDFLKYIKENNFRLDLAN